MKEANSISVTKARLELNAFEKLSGWVAGAILFLLMRPYIVWFFVEYENWYAILPLYLILLLNVKKGLESSEIHFYIIFAFLTIFAGFCAGSNIVGLTFAPLLTSLFITSKQFLVYTYKCLWYIFTIIMLLSLIVYFLLLFGISIPGIFLPPLNELKDDYYFVYPFLTVLNGDLSYGFLALFDEKGVVGTMCTFFLFIEKCNLKKIGNLIILVSGILSFSLFFYLVLFIYLSYLTIFENTYKKYRFSFLIIIIAGIIAATTTEIGKEKIVDRLSLTEKSDDRLFAGDNRASEDLKYYVSTIRGTSTYFFGTKDKNIKEMAQSSASIQNVIVRYGFVTLMSYLIFYFFYGAHLIKQRRALILFMLFLLLTLYNRPYIFNPVFVFLFNMVIFSYSSSPKN